MQSCWTQAGCNVADATTLPVSVLVRAVSCAECWFELCCAASVDHAWCAACGSKEIEPLRRKLCQSFILPRAVRAVVKDIDAAKQARAEDWCQFCTRQQRLQVIFAGTYIGTLTPENLFSTAQVEDFDWGQQHQVYAKLHQACPRESLCGQATQIVFAEEDELDAWSHDYEWLVLDRRSALDDEVWKALAACSSTKVGRISKRGGGANRRGVAEHVHVFELPAAERPPERWEDGDCLCGVRSTCDYRPVVDPEFLSLSTIGVLLLPKTKFEILFLGPRLYAPCSWMFPKTDVGQARLASSLDFWTEFRDDRTVAALALGKRLERALTFDEIEALLPLMRGRSTSTASTGSGASACSTQRECNERKPQEDSCTSRRARRAAKTEQRRMNNDPRNQCSGRNPKGLHYFVPRRRCEATTGRASVKGGDAKDGHSGGSQTARKSHPPRDSVLRCQADADSLKEFLAQNLPTHRRVERLWVSSAASVASGRDSVVSACSSGLLSDAQRLEAESVLNHATVVDLARKWNFLTGKWLLFVPEWRVDTLFISAARRLAEGQFGNCTDIMVSPPGSYGIDPDRFMVSAHCPDFTDRQETMTVGKCLRAVAREGIRAPAGDWGELHDNPFAAKGKKVSLAFKPDVFSHLGIHRNNPYNIKVSLYTIDL